MGRRTPLYFKAPKDPELKKIFEELKFIADKMRNENLTSEYEDEWKYAAIVVDRFLTFAILKRKKSFLEYQRLFSYQHWSLHFSLPFVLEPLKIKIMVISN